MEPDIVRMQTPWEETHEEVENRRRMQTKEPGWSGTIIGLVLAAFCIAALILTR